MVAAKEAEQLRLVEPQFGFYELSGGLRAINFDKVVSASSLVDTRAQRTQHRGCRRFCAYG